MSYKIDLKSHYLTIENSQLRLEKLSDYSDDLTLVLPIVRYFYYLIDEDETYMIWREIKTNAEYVSACINGDKFYLNLSEMEFSYYLKEVIRFNQYTEIVQGGYLRNMIKRFIDVISSKV